MINKLILSKTKKGEGIPFVPIIIALLILGIIAGFLFPNILKSMKEGMTKFSSGETGDYGDPDQDGIQNIYDKCPSKACVPKKGETVEKNIMDPRSGCTVSQTPSTDRKATTC